MPKQTTLDDIAESITDLTSMMAAEFNKVYEKFDRVDIKFDAVTTGAASLKHEMHVGFSEVHSNQREIQRRLTLLEGDHQAHEADIKELYKLKSKR